MMQTPNNNKKNFCWCWRYLCVFPQKMTWLRTNLKSCKFVYNSAYHMSMTVFTWSKWTFYYDYYDYYYYYYYYYFHYCSFIIKTKYGCESDLRNNEHYLSSSKTVLGKKFSPVQDLNPWPLQNHNNNSRTWLVITRLFLKLLGHCTRHACVIGQYASYERSFVTHFAELSFFMKT